MGTWIVQLPIINGIATATIQAKDETEAKEKLAKREFADVGDAEWDVDETKPTRLREVGTFSTK